MSDFLSKNKSAAEIFKTVLKLSGEPVAVKLIKEESEYPTDLSIPEGQLSHCQAIMRARKGECLNVPFASESCNVGASVLGMVETPEKLKTGEFHYSIGIHESPEAAAKMFLSRKVISYKTIGETICPLKDADFEPDAVVFVDIPEKLYWILSAYSAEGQRSELSTAPFQCMCEDAVALPIIEEKPNLSLGCFGCRRRTDIKPEELVVGVPYNLVSVLAERIAKYESGVLTKAKRD